MCPLRPRKDRRLRAGRGSRRKVHLDPLVSHELHTGASVLSPAPRPPEQRRGTRLERMEQDTDPTWLRGCFPVPLTLFAQRAAAIIAHPGAIEHAQTAIGFAALLGGVQRLASRTGQRPIRLQTEVLSRETTRFPGQGDRRLAIALHWGLATISGCELADLKITASFLAK